MRNRASWMRARWALAAVLWLIAPSVALADLQDVIPGLYGGDGIALATSRQAAFPQFTAPTNNELLLLNNAISSNLNLFGSGTAVASFEFDPAQAIFVRSEDSLGPIVGERADTIGRGKFNFGMAYTNVQFKKFAGQDLDSFLLVFDHLDGCAQSTLPSSSPFRWQLGDSDVRNCTFVSNGGIIPDGLDLGPGGEGFPSPPELDSNGNFVPFTGPAAEFDKIRTILDIDLEQQIFSMFLNYGITDNWEVGIVIPLVSTRIKVNSIASVIRSPNFTGSVANHQFCLSPTLAGNPFPGRPDTDAECDGIRRDPTTGVPTGEFVPRDVTRDSRSDEAFGFGDIILRTKWNPYEGEGWIPDLAVLGRMRAPSGNEKNFLGTGEWLFSGFAVASIRHGWFSPHANLGIEVSTDSIFNNFSWLAGADFRLHERVTLVTDFLGRYAFENRLVGRNLADFSVGTKINVIGTLNILANTIIPMNPDDGLRPDVTWSVGWEATF